MQRETQLEHPLQKCEDVKLRIRTVGHFLSEYMKLELRDPSISVRTEYLEGGEILVRCEKRLENNYSLALLSEKRKAYQLETKADVLRWITEMLQLARKRYEEMPKVEPITQ